MFKYYINYIWILKSLILDIFSFFKMRKKIKSLSETEVWASNNLRYDWFYRIYTVLNIQNGVTFYDENDFKKYLVTRLIGVNELILSADLGDFLYPKWSPIDGYHAYFVRYLPVFRFLSVKNVLWFILYTIFLYFLIFNFLIRINYASFIK